MKAIDWLFKLLGLSGPAAPDLVGLLEKLKAAVPDTAPEVDDAISQLTGAVQPMNLLGVAQAIIEEVKAGKVNPRAHPSDGF